MTESLLDTITLEELETTDRVLSIIIEETSKADLIDDYLVLRSVIKPVQVVIKSFIEVSKAMNRIMSQANEDQEDLGHA